MANTPNRHQQWEDQWRDAFEGAEAPLPPHVWKNIESELAIQETGKYRRGFLFYRAIAAALLLLIAGLSWYTFTQQKDTNPSLSDSNSRSTPSETSAPEASLPVPPSEGPSLSPTGDDTKSGASSEPAGLQGERSTERSVADATSRSRQPEERVSSDAPPALAYQDNMRQSTSRKKDSGLRSASQSSTQASTGSSVSPPSNAAEAIIPLRSDATADNQALAEPVTGSGVSTVRSRGIAGLSLTPPASLAHAEQLYQVPQPMIAYQKSQKDKNKRESRPEFFAGLTLSPGYFDPKLQSSVMNPSNVLTVNGPSGAPGQGFDRENALSDALVPSNSSGINDEPQLSFTYGVDVGMKLSDHWVIESGIDYNRFSTNTETRWAVADVASGNSYLYLVANSYQLDRSASNPSPTMTTAVNNAYEFISVPMQIGYQIAVSKLNFVVSSGIAANFFLGNNISAPASPFTSTRVSAESDSPFKALYYSGVLRGGVNYAIQDNYSLTLTPSYAFALTELTKQESTLNSQPYSFGINVGFQYQF